jgi:hypothetical protein
MYERDGNPYNPTHERQIFNYHRMIQVFHHLSIAVLVSFSDVGIPGTLHTDDAKEQTSGKWREVCKAHGIKQTLTEPYSPFQNRAEVNIHEVKKHVRRITDKTRTPKRLWDFCATYVAEL